MFTENSVVWYLTWSTDPHFGLDDQMGLPCPYTI